MLMCFTQITVELLIICTNKHVYGNFTCKPCKINTYEPESFFCRSNINTKSNVICYSSLNNDEDDFRLYT